MTDLLTKNTSGYPSYNWGTFLHIDPASPLVNAGHVDGDVDPDDTSLVNEPKYFRDVDDQVEPLGDLVGNGKPAPDNALVYRRDIGADEVPTPLDVGSTINAIHWFERF